MNFDLAAWLNRAKAYYSGLEGRQRRNLWIIAIIVLLLVIILSSVLLNPNYETVFSNLDAKSAGQITQKLDESKIPYQLQGTDILVPASMADQARIDMAMDGLPSSGTIDYSQIFQGSTFGMSDQELTLQVLNVLQGRIAQSIESINGIEDAQVNIVMPQTQSFLDPSTNYGAKASVLVTVGAGASLDPGQVAGIQQLVAHAVQGLNASDVTVVDQYGNDLSAANGGGGSSFGATGSNAVSAELAAQMQVEQQLQTQLQNTLQNLVGQGNLSVIVHANVSFNQVSTQSHQVQAGPPLSAQAASSTSSGGGSGTGGVAGQATQNSNLVTYGSSGNGGQSQSSQRSSTTNYDNSYTDVTSTGQPMQIQGYTVSVLVNSNAVTLSPTLRQTLQSLVLTAIGQTASRRVVPTVTVAALPFAPGIGVLAGQSSPLTGPLGIGAGVALLLLVGGGLLLARRSRRRKQITSQAIESLSAASLVNAPEETPEGAISRQLKDLAVRRPDAFASLLRSWLAEE